MLLGALAVILALSIVIVFGAIRAPTTRAIVCLVLGSVLAAIVVEIRRPSRKSIARRWLIVLSFLIIGTTVFALGGFAGNQSLVMGMAVLTAGLLLGKRAVYATGAFSVLSASLVGWLMVTGRLPPAPSADVSLREAIPWVRVILIAALLWLFTALLVTSIVSVLEAAIRRSLDEQRRREELNRERDAARHEIAERMHAEEALRHAKAAVEAASKDVEAASRAKSEFLSSMSHELRTPLNAILGFAQLLQRDRREPLSDRHRERVDHIVSGGEHLLKLINDVLDLSKIEAGRISIVPEAVDVAEVIAEVARTLDPIATRHKIALESSLVGAQLPRVHADRTRVVQILMNFGSNAIKYNRTSGRVRIEASITLTPNVRVTVTDTGLGIPIEKQSKLFQPFQRAGQETGPIEGTGIGLAITKRLAEMMDGRVGFRSVPDQGSEFWVELPLHEGEEIPESLSPAMQPAVSLPPAKGHHLVLCVEDNPANIVFMRDVMSTIDNVDLVTVPTAELGIELARARRPKLVLMDINLPGMSGLDALRALKSCDETCHIPVIALTAAASERDQKMGLEAGFHRYLSKPINLDELIEAIDSVRS